MGGREEALAQLPDDVIARRFQESGDNGCFAELFVRYRQKVFLACRGFFPDGGTAEDTTQEAFLRAWRGLAGWRREGAFSTWLFALAMNVYRSELKRIPVPPVSLEQVADIRDLRPQDGGLEAENRDRAVRRAVAALPLKYREVLILYYFHEMDIAATAGSLALPEGTAKARLYRGRELLRAKLPKLLTIERAESDMKFRESTDYREARR